MTKAKALTEEQWLASNEPHVLLRHLQQHCNLGRARGGSGYSPAPRAVAPGTC
jgi:hypothetical protein